MTPATAALTALLFSVADAAEMTLDEVLDRAASAPQSRAAEHRAGAARADATTAWLAAVGPTVGVSSSAMVRDQELAVSTPFGDFPQQPEEEATAGVLLTVPLVDPAALARGPAASRMARSADADAERATQLASLRAGEAFLDVVALDAQIVANEAYLDSLRSVGRQARDRVEAGLALEADALRAEVALADAAHDAFALARTREVAAWNLGASLGLAESVEPAFRWQVPTVPGDVDQMLDRARDRRPDLRSARRAVDALRAERVAVGAEWLPKLEATGSWSWTDSDQLIDNTWLEGGLRLTWVPVAGGTRMARLSAAGSRLAEARAGLERLERGVEVEVRQAAAQVAVASDDVAVRQQAVVQAEEARRIVSDRYGEDLATMTDVLQVEADAHAQRTRLRIAEVEATRASLRLRVATGVPDDA